MKYLIQILSFFSAALLCAEPLLFQESFSTPESVGKYDPWVVKTGYIREKDGSGALKLFLAEHKPIGTIRIPLNPQEVAGKRLRISAELKGEKIAPAKERFNGGKFMMPVETPSGTLYPGAQLSSGSFGWGKKSFVAEIPWDVKKVSIVLGFQDSFGTLLVRNLKVEDLGTALDLRPIVNMGFADPKANDGRGGWSDQGSDNDASGFRIRPDGLYAGFPFRVIAPETNGGKSVLSMKSFQFPGGSESAETVLKQPVKASYLYLLHTMCHNAKGVAGELEIAGAGGKIQKIPVTIGKDVADWWNPKRLENAYPAVLWNTAQGGTVGVYVSGFRISPGISPVKSVTFRSVNQVPVWILLGATLSETEHRFPDLQKFVTGESAKWRPLPPAKPGVIAGSALDRSALTRKTAVTERVIANSAGQLALEGSPDVPVRFLTVADSYETFQMFRSKKHIEEYARQLRLQGYNMARLHYLDSILMSGAKKALEFNPKNLDKFDYYVYCMKKNGIYLNFDAMCSLYGYDLGNPWYPDKSGRNFGYDIYFKESVRENWRKGVGKLLTHVNPYTKTRLAEDPVLAIVNGKNEQEFALMAWKYPENPQYMLPSWREFLKRRYQTISAFNSAWAMKGKDWQEIPVFTRQDATARNRRGEDVARYKSELESGMYDWYVAELRKMGYRGIVINYDMGQNLRYIALRRPFQAIGMHSYHGHPSSSGPFEQTIDQSSSLSNANAVFRGISSTRLTGKPLLVTEYGIVFWNKYRYEEAFAVGAYAAFQDYSALTVHSQTVSIRPETAIRPFGCTSDPVIHASEFLTAYLFRRGDVAPARAHIRLDLNTETMYRERTFLDGIHSGQSRLCLLTGVSTAVDPDFPVRKNELAISSSGGSTVMTRPGYTMVVDKPGAPFDINTIMNEFKKQGLVSRSNRTDAAKGIFENSSQELYLDVRKRFLSVNTPKLQGICAEAGIEPVRLGHFRVSNLTTRGNVALVSVDGLPLSESRRMVLVYATNALNTGMEFLSGDMRTLRKPGETPVLVETGSFRFGLENRNAGRLKLYALATDGSRRFSLPLEAGDGSIRGTIDTAGFRGGPSLYFELVAER